MYIPLWLHDLDVNKMLREKAKWEIHKNVTYCSEQDLEATLHKTVVIGPHAPHLTSHPNKTDKTYGSLLEK